NGFFFQAPFHVRHEGSAAANHKDSSPRSGQGEGVPFEPHDDDAMINDAGKHGVKTRAQSPDPAAKRDGGLRGRHEAPPTRRAAVDHATGNRKLTLSLHTQARGKGRNGWFLGPWLWGSRGSRSR